MKKLKSILALCFAFLMAFGMSVSVNAADNDNGISTGAKATVTVYGSESDKDTSINAYKLININYNYTNNQLEEPVYTWVSSVGNYLLNSESDIFKKYVDYADETNYRVTQEFLDATASDVKNLYESIISDKDFTSIVGDSVINDVSITQTGNTTYSASFSAQIGWYLVIADSESTSTYDPMTAFVQPVYDSDQNIYTLPNVDIYLKGSKPSITKTATTDNGEKSVAVGDTVKYTITSEIPVYPSDAVNIKYAISDTLSDGLTFVENTEDSESRGLSITIDGKAVPTDSYSVVLDTDIDPEFTDGYVEGSSFTIIFKYDSLTSSSEYMDADNKVITVTYEATVNDNAVIGTDPISNEAILHFANDPYDPSSSDSTTETETVYTYGINIAKQSASSNDNEHSFLTGAQFEVYKDDSSVKDRTPISFVNEGSYYRPLTKEESVAYADDPNSVPNVTTLITVADSGDFVGNLSIRGIDLGTYYIKEVIAPAGYVLPENDFTVVLGESGTLDGNLDKDATKISDNFIGNVNLSGGINVTSVTPNIGGVTLYNISSSDTSFELPTTGGMGTVIFTVGGIAVMAAAVALGIYSSRKRNA